MKIKSNFLKPRFATFVRLFVLYTAATYALITLYQIFLSTDPFDLRLPFPFVFVFLFPAALAIGLSLGTKPLEIKITDLKNTDLLHLPIHNYLIKNGYSLKIETENQIIYHSKNGFNRVFNDWFGLERVIVLVESGSITVIGPYRIMIDLDTFVKKQPAVKA